MPSIQGFRTVEVEKDTTHCKWIIKSPKGDIMYEVSWRHAFEAHKIKNDEFYTCLYTAMCHHPLTDADRAALFVKFPHLRNENELEIDPADRPRVLSSSPPAPTPQPKAEKKAGKTSYKRKVEL